MLGDIGFGRLKRVIESTGQNRTFTIMNILADYTLSCSRKGRVLHGFTNAMSDLLYIDRSGIDRSLIV